MLSLALLLLSLLPMRSASRCLTAACLVALIASGTAAGRVHHVKAGDTLDALGRRYGVSVSKLAQANAIPNADHILAGSRLVVPAEGSATAAPASKPVAAKPAAAKPAAPKQIMTGGGARPVRIPPDRARLRPLFVQHSKKAGVPADLAMALAWQESGWQTGVVSSARAVGVMQVMPDTVEFVSRILLRLPRNLDARDPAANIRLGTRFLRYLLDRAGGNVDLALASYYQGLRSVRENGPLEETRRFVANVKALRARF